MSDPLKYYTENAFLSPSSDLSVFYGFFTRFGGVSEYPYAGLNCGLGSGDKEISVFQNRSMVEKKAGLPSGSMMSAYQIHGAEVIYIDRLLSERPKADALVTDVPSLGLGILTADCTPVLFVGKKIDNSPVIGAAHAGWQGALKGVLENTVMKMEELGALRGTIRACVGPCISKASYEVSHEFMVKFLEESEESERFFHDGIKEGHAQFDLSGYCAWRLFRAEVKNISILDKDTYSNESEFFSFRRATHRKEADYGRQVSMICIQE